MRVGGLVVGALLVLTGLVWIGQGLGYIPGSFMTGDVKWFWIGCVMAVAGLGVGVAAWRARGAGPGRSKA